METGLDTAVLTILGSAFGVMFATMTTLMFVSIRGQHRESTNTRDLIERSNQEHRKANQETREEFTRQLERAVDTLTDTLTAQNNETQRTLAKIVDSLADARERLARLEGTQHHNTEAPTHPDIAGSGAAA